MTDRFNMLPLIGSGCYHQAVTDLVFAQVTSRQAVRRWHRVASAAADADLIDLPPDPVDDTYARITGTRQSERVELWNGSINDDVVVIGEVKLPLLDNLTIGVTDVRTHPAFRRRGHGIAMLDHLRVRARTHGRSRLIGEVCEPLHADELAPPVAGVAFATHVGATPATSEVRSVLRLPIAADTFDTLRSDALTHAAGYSVVAWQGPAADEIVDDLAQLHARLSTDAPLEDLEWQPEHWTASRYREAEASMLAAGRVRFSAAARHDASGRIVALTEIGVATSKPEAGHQWLTIVQTEHRGHRLGMLVKTANLEQFRAKWPAAKRVNTWNAAINGHMISINESLGYLPIERWREWQLELDR